MPLPASIDSATPTSIVESFRAVVEQVGEKVALRCREETLSYIDLDRKSDALATTLIRKGVAPGTVVGISPEPRVELLVALLAILKAGGIYLPLDKSSPAEQITFQARDADVGLLIGHCQPLEETGVKVLAFEDFPTEAVPEIDLPILDRNDAAYLLYTSGTTGEPKGVLVPHRAILRLVIDCSFARLGEKERILHHSPLAFDASTFEIWGPLLNGGELVLFPKEDFSLRHLSNAIREYEITTLWLTAGLFHAMVDERIEDLAPLRQLLAGGDVLSPARVATLLSHYPDLALINGYGPTENTTFTCCHRIDASTLREGEPIPIGTAIRGTKVHILDEELQPVGEGKSGELCTSGDGLALGYWNRPNLAEQKFVGAPWDPEVRLYRTGDQVQRDNSGLIHFEGRIDQQVKIRGYRIELSGIESALESLPEIEAAVVLAEAGKEQADKRLLAFLVASEKKIPKAELISRLSLILPAYEIPRLFEYVEKIPLTPNGKVDRKALLAHVNSEKQPGPKRSSSSSNSPIEEIFADLCRVDSVPADTNFFDLGLSSLDIARAHQRIESALGIEFPITAFFQHTTVRTLTAQLASVSAPSATPDSSQREHQPTHSDAIAIVGMAGRFPGAPDVNTFWDNLLAGRETISHFSREELDYENADGDPNSSFVRARGIVEGSDLFDARHFGIPPRDAELLDPQHRLLLECAQHTLEDSGHDPDRFSGKIGLFSGSSQNSYLLNNLCTDRNFARKLAAGYPVSDFGILFGNDKDFLPTRIAYKLNLKGPAMAVQCACSTSLVAVTQACESLRSGTCDMALAGGVSLTFPQKRDYLHTPEGMASSDGHCRTFDADASGTVFGEGVGLVALRRLDDALADGDNVVAVIRGFALNNDGSEKAGYAAPSVSGQVDMILEAHRNAEVDAESIGYIEAHGTGTPLGDPIEVAALSEAFRQTTKKKQFCGIGTAKTNVGHLDIAAGVTGLIKAALSVKHGQMPPLVHYQKPNPKIDFSSSAFFPVTDLREWENGENPRRAGVSALGVGGTNVHVILEEPPSSARPSGTKPEGTLFFPLSASTPKALEESVGQLESFVAKYPQANLADISYTLQEGRRQFGHRTVIAARSQGELAKNCQSHSAKVAKASPNFRELAFLFPGQGAQHLGMAREVYESEPVFREVLDRCAKILEPEIGLNLIDLIVPDPKKEEEMAAILRDTSLAQPAIFSVSYALARQWEHWGIEPSCLVGHSIGEFAAACFAGVFPLEDALRLIAMRGRLMSELPGGIMLSVRATEKELSPYLDGDFDLAAINGPKSCVLAGPTEGAEGLEENLERAGFVSKRLHTSHAFHSRMMEPIVDEFAKAISSIALCPPERRIFSTVSADWLTDELATDPHYWAGHLRKPVRFFDVMSELWQNRDLGYLEVGPGNTLATLAGQNPDRSSLSPAIASLPHPSQDESSHQHLLHAAGSLWSHGYPLDWKKLEERDDSPRRRISLPLYPFQRKRFWVEPPEDVSAEEIHSESESEESISEETSVTSETVSVETSLKEMLSELSGLDPDEIDSEATFLELGLDSLLLTQASREIQDRFGVKITLRQLIDSFSSVTRLGTHLEEEGTTGKTSHVSVPQSIALPEVARESTSPISVPALKIESHHSVELTPRQRAHVDDLVSRYTKKTAGSKAFTAKYRRAHADPRTASGFNRAWKEMVYQIVTEKSAGSRLLDVDGNEYIDILNGFGPGFLGHSPPFLIEAIEEQLHQGIEVGPNQQVAMEAAELFCEVTGNERTSFVCTGSEAVQASMRLARTVTGRDKIVIFERDYHGNFDEVLVRGANGKNGLKSIPHAPGIPKRAAGDMIVLPYGTEESLSIIRELADELAAVIVEPVQSRRPDFRPHDFIREVRAITESSGTLFVFDEVVTGFRFGPGGAQDYYGIDADLATYGKVVGGGMPVGVVSGKARYMDTFDGGDWHYGDDSFPEKPVTFFAGTFVRHPLAMASVKAMLTFLKKQPLHFWQAINAKGDRLARTVDAFFQRENIPCQLPNCGSLMYARMEANQPFGNLLFYHLREKGVFLLEGFPSYLTAAHSDEDIDYVIDAFQNSAREMQEVGFFPESESGVVHATATHGLPEILARGKTPDPPDFKTSFTVSTTPSQREIVVASAMGTPASCAFNESASLTFSGELNLSILRRAIALLAERHDSIRATFSRDGTEMEFHSDLTIPLTEIELASDADHIELLHSEASTPFDLRSGPLMRMKLARTNDTSSTLVITAHHAICDGWSFNVIAEELSAFYGAFVADQENSSRFAEPKQFAEYARDRHRFVGSADHASARDFWLEKFQSLPDPIALPLDRPYPAKRTFAGGTVEHRIDRDTYLAIKKAGAKQGSTLHTTLSGVFALLLHRLTGQDDLVYCIPMAGQNQGEGNDNLIGHCVQFLPLRSRVAEGQTVASFLEGNRSVILDASDHQSYSYGELIQDLKIPRDPRRMPLGEVAFNVERMDYFGDWTGLECRFEPNPKTNVHYTLFMNVVESDKGLRFDVDFNADVLDRSTVARWTHHYGELLESVAKNVDTQVSDLSLLGEMETEMILRNWSGAAEVSSKPFQAVTDYFQQALALDPEAIALCSDSESLSYQELDQEATRAAANLQAAGVTRGDFVGVIAERSSSLVSTLLGILKTGAAYVPIDPGYPEARIQMMLEDCEAKFVVGDTEHADKAGDTSFQSIASLISDAGNPFEPVSLTGEDIAYVIYTSGSTGQPKGTLIPHRGIARLVKDTDYICFDSDQTFLLSSPITFDASTLELWGPLLNGGRLVLLPPGIPGLSEIGAAIERFEVTTLWLTAGLFQLMVDERPDDLRPLQQLLVGGDVVSPDHARKALSILGEKGRLLNGYGPTENTTFTTCHPITLADTEGTSIPIGRPIRNTTVCVLDPQMRPVPPGVKGRLFIGGAGLSIGYLNQPEQTRERFLTNPFSEIPGEWLYDSGDDCRWLADGTIEFLGRDDDQVKVRGFRIETAEIERALASASGIKRAAVTAVGSSADNKQLLAFLLIESGFDESRDSVLQHARTHLPSYMIPNRIEFCREFPVTPNGKVDYRALVQSIEREPKPIPSSQHHQPPRTKTEESVMHLFSEILEVDSIDRNDDFFDLGGHSLVGLKLFLRIQNELGVSLPLATLFQSSSIANLSARVDEKRQSANSSHESLLTKIREGDPSTPPLFLVHGGDGGTLFYKDFIAQIHFPGAIYTIETPLLGGAEGEPAALASPASKYLSEIRKIHPKGSCYLGGYSFGGAIAYEIAHQIETSGKTVEKLFLFDTANPARESDFQMGMLRRLRREFSSSSENGFCAKGINLARRIVISIGRRIRRTKQLVQLKLHQGDVSELRQDLETLRILQIHTRQMNSYSPPRYAGDVILFRAETQVENYDFNREMGWESLVDSLSVIDIPGSHRIIFDQPHLNTLSKRFNEATRLPGTPTSSVSV